MTSLLFPSIHTSPSQMKNKKPPVDMRRVAAIILSGGQGTRLYPLTLSRSKPAMSFGGRYCLIDVPISNAINSGVQNIFVITQFLSSSLNQHVMKTYQSNSISLQLLSSEERPDHQIWFQGTADAVRQNLNYISEVSADYFLILSGDQLYQMNFQKMLSFAHETDADLVVASLPVTETDAKRMGILQVNEDSFITAFREKPQTPEELYPFRSTLQIQKIVNSPLKLDLDYLGSMGIYLFKREALLTLLSKDHREDFGKHLIPTQLAIGNVASYIFHGYWEDIGTLESFYRANIALTQHQSFLNEYSEEWPIYSKQHLLPAPFFADTKIDHSIICEGSIIAADEIKNSILGPRTVVSKGTVIHDSYLFGNDMYAPITAKEHLPEKFQIGNNCRIRKSIIDKQVYIGNNVQLLNKNNVSHYDSPYLYVRDGIIVVPYGTTLPDGFMF